MDDPELEKTKQDTLEVFVQYAKLLSQEKDPNYKCAEEGDRHGAAVSSPTAAEETSARPQLTRSKSRDAACKDLHPKRVLSVKPVVVDSHHCRAAIAADAKQSCVKTPSSLDSSSEASNPISHAPPSPSTGSCANSVVKAAARPGSLLPAPRRGDPSLHSTEGLPQARDPPMEPILSPISTDFTTSYPPASVQLLQGANLPAVASGREGLAQSAEHARSVAQPSCSKIPSAHDRSLDLSADAAIADSDPRGVKARKIADRLKEIGDMVEDEHVRSKIDDIMAALNEIVSLEVNPAQVVYTLLMFSRTELSWRRVVEIFKLLCYVSKYDDQFTLFEKVWHCLLDKIVPWIQDNGGWSAFLRANSSPSCQASTPSVVRRHPVPAQSEPTLAGCATPTLRHSRQSACIQRDIAESRAMIGRMAFTPQMTRQARREQSSPCLSQSYTQSQATPTLSETGRRSRLWSLTETGSFKREDGQEDLDRSISEFDMDAEEDDTFAHSQEEEEGEREGEIQDEDRTLTSSSLRPALSSVMMYPSPPITVPSPHSCSQPDPTDDLHSDSGIENLSLSCSPPRVGFSVGGVASHRQSPMLLARNQTSLTSLSSAASASPVHTSPSSRKNSSSNGTFGHGGRTRPRSSGSFKESNHRHGNETTSGGFYRTGSLTRPHPTMATPTSTATPTQFGRGSSHHGSWSESPNVRRVSRTAYEMYEIVKAIFDGP